ncbi:MAG: hypothetical protein NDI69_18110 [Bacteriovoracaceae bacterium]|nr:hypothetical protein [Bacteriovoracaceae bacterium]
MTENSPQKSKYVRVRITPEMNEKLLSMLKDLKETHPHLKITKSQLLAFLISEFCKKFEDNKKFRERAIAELRKL